MSSARELIKSLREDPASLDTSAGISLLSLKHHVLLSYLNSLVLLSARRALGHTLLERSPPVLPFSSLERGPRGAHAGDLVDAMVEGRIVLEKIKTLEGRMRYQIDKLVKVAEEGITTSSKVIDDPLAFRPNPQNLMDNNDDADRHSDHGNNNHANDGDGIYRPPRLAATPYISAPTSKKSRRKPLPSGLSSLQHADPALPTTESTSGLGAMPSLTSSRARELARLTQFEEENFTRVVMKKSEAKRRVRDEEDVALGGGATGGNRRRAAGGLADEFGDVLRSVGRDRRGAVGDGYEELRVTGRKGGVLARSRVRAREDAFGGGVEEGEGERSRKKSRFEKERKVAAKKVNKVRR